MLYGTFLTVQHFSEPSSTLSFPFVPYPVSILKPLKGMDKGIEENLESFFKLEYPDYELIFSVNGQSDPVCQLVESLIVKYPQTQARLILGKVDIGPNPKVNNLVMSYKTAANDWLLISDSNVRVDPLYLKRLVSQIKPEVGLITSVVAGHHAQGMGGYLEAIVLNTFYARGMIMADRLDHPCVVGKSMLFRRSVANRFGGIDVLSRYLAEDYMAGEAIRRLGLRVVTSVDPIPQFIGRYSFYEFWSRHLRWGRIRKSQAPLVFAIEPWFGCMVSGLLGVLGAKNLFGISPSLFMILHLSLWSFCDLLILKKLRSKLTFQVPIAWFLRELLALPLWICIAFGNTVQWRGKQFILEPGGTLKTSFK